LPSVSLNWSSAGPGRVGVTARLDDGGAVFLQGVGGDVRRLSRLIQAVGEFDGLVGFLECRAEGDHAGRGGDAERTQGLDRRAEDAQLGRALLDHRQL
jgi:hypothetical protein